MEQDSVANGMCGPSMNRPARLAKLEMRRKKTKRVLTQEEIEAKLERAEERRKVGASDILLGCYMTKLWHIVMVIVAVRRVYHYRS